MALVAVRKPLLGNLLKSEYAANFGYCREVVTLTIAGGAELSLVTRQGGEVVVFGRGEVGHNEDEEGNELGELVMEADGCLGLGADVGNVLEATVVPGLRVDHHQSV